MTMDILRFCYDHWIVTLLFLAAIRGTFGQAISLVTTWQATAAIKRTTR